MEEENETLETFEIDLPKGLTKQDIIFSLVVLSLVILLVGVTVRYNRTVKDYNALVSEVNDCRNERQQPFSSDYWDNTRVGSPLYNDAKGEGYNPDA